MTKRRKSLALLLAGVAIVAMILLSAGISQLELLSGRPFSLGRGSQFGIRLGEATPGGDFIVTAILALSAMLQLLLPFAIIYLLVSPKARKQFLRSLSSLLWLLALYLLLRSRVGVFGEQEIMPPPDAVPAGEVVPEVEFVAAPSQWFVFVMNLAVALLLAAVVVGGLWFLLHRRRQPTSSLEQIAWKAQDALQALRAGGDLRNTVLRCYFEMSRVLSEQRGITRAKAMTPREFERYLEEAGLPGEHVRGLTRIFEGVRYGAKVPGEDDESHAIACLTRIVEACGSLS